MTLFSNERCKILVLDIVWYLILKCFSTKLIKQKISTYGLDAKKKKLNILLWVFIKTNVLGSKYSPVFFKMSWFILLFKKHFSIEKLFKYANLAGIIVSYSYMNIVLLLTKFIFDKELLFASFCYLHHFAICTILLLVSFCYLYHFAICVILLFVPSKDCWLHYFAWDSIGELQFSEIVTSNITKGAHIKPALHFFKITSMEW